MAISFKQIRYALAVEKFLHFKKAAEYCSISQSALSNALAELERQLGFQIFERDNRKVLVTPAGRTFLERAQEIHVQVQQLNKLKKQFDDPLSGTLRVGMIPTIAPFLLPRILPGIKSRYPELELVVEEEQSEVLVERVARGLLDTAILALPYDCAGLLTFPFWQENFYLIAHRDDEMARHKIIAADEIDVSRLMLLTEGHCLKDHALTLCHLPDRQSQVNLAATSLATLVQLVLSKQGATLVPGIALDQLVSRERSLVALELAEPGPHRELAFIVRPNYPSLPDIELLAELITEILEK